MYTCYTWVIKAENSKACWLLLQVEQAVHKYVALQNILVDYTRHGTTSTRKCYRPTEMESARTTHNAASDSMKDATTVSSSAGNRSSEHNLDSTLRTKGCVIGHYAFVLRMGSRTQNIELQPGPAQSYNTKSAIHALKEFGQQLLPLTQTIETLFQSFLPEEHSKYTAVYETIYYGKADNVDEVFRIWTSRSLVINVNTNNHKNLETVCHGWYTIVVLGDIEACFPELEVKIELFFFFFYIIYSLLRYKKSHGALAMAKTKP